MSRDAIDSPDERLPSPQIGSSSSELDPYVSPGLRAVFEETYYAHVNTRGSVDQLSRDTDFLLDPVQHVGFFADHGVAHVRDIAARVLYVLDRLHGVLIPPRSRRRFHFMQGYAVLTAYVHDIGMADFSPFGRTVHPEAGAQIVYDPSFSPILERIWEEDSGGVRTRIQGLMRSGVLHVDQRTVLRELLAMAACHSKRAAPAATLADPVQLRRIMQEAIRTHLHRTYERRSGAEATLGVRLAPDLRHFYQDVERESFLWLTDGGDLVDDVMDVLRALRCADALRQRGSSLRTSGTYQLFVDQITGNAICGIERDDVMWYVELSDPVPAGEANLAGTDLDADGNLWVSFHHGSFASPEAMTRAERSAARVIEDVQADIIPTLADRWPQRPRNSVGPLIFIEHVDDNPDFAGRVANELLNLNPAIAPIVRLAPSLDRAAERERRRYLGASGDPISADCVDDLLRRIACTGHRVDDLDRNAAFEAVRLAAVHAGEVVMAAGEPAGFVYIPLGPGLRVEPLGGYPPRHLPAWSPVGTTAIIGGAPRNGTVIAERPMDLLMIPRDTYLKHWYRTYSLDEFLHQLNDQQRRRP